MDNSSLFLLQVQNSGISASSKKTCVRLKEFLKIKIFFVGFEFYCLGSWTDEDGNVWMGVRDRGEDVHRYKYRCLVSS